MIFKIMPAQNSQFVIFSGSLIPLLTRRKEIENKNP